MLGRSVYMPGCVSYLAVELCSLPRVLSFPPAAVSAPYLTLFFVWLKNKSLSLGVLSLLWSLSCMSLPGSQGLSKILPVRGCPHLGRFHLQEHGTEIPTGAEE